MRIRISGLMRWRMPVGCVRRMPEGGDMDLAFEPDE